ncbi:MAG: Ni/Fe hydrogenase subunit alpha [Chromatiales bacterium]|nr:Ni/Fe hydrogenase subunit alpha [Chromatiales bacterium]
MNHDLETAEHPETLKRVVIEPLTRVEGHGKVTLLLDEDEHIQQARLHIVEFRGFEKFIQGRPYWEVPVLVQRLCGICPVSHHLAAAKAVDALVGVRQLPPTAEKIRRLIHFGQTLQSHAVHFFHLSSPDLLFGFEDEVSHRNIVGVIADHPDIALKGVKLRKFGQEVIRVVSGKRVHGTLAVPGGVNKALSREDRDYLLRQTDEVLAWSRDAVDLVKRLYVANSAFHDRFGRIDSHWLSLVDSDGNLEIYDGSLRTRDDSGCMIFDQAPCDDYAEFIREGIKPWTYMKFPFLITLGREDGWYRVGPLARVNNCDQIATPLAEAQRREFLAQDAAGHPIRAPLAYHWARMIELLHCAEAIVGLLRDPDILGGELQLRGEPRQEGIGVIEAPRGTLFHHYRIDEQGLIEKANLIVSTTNNNQAMNESIRAVAREFLDGHELTEGLLNHIEVAIRAYDPCLSCATHAVGKMPLSLELLDCNGRLLNRLERNSRGSCELA